MLPQIMCGAAFVVGLILMLFTAVVYVGKRRRADGNVSFTVFGQTFSGGMLGSFLVVGLILTLFSIVEAKHEESSVTQAVTEATDLVAKAKEAGAASHAPTEWQKTTETKNALDKELATQNAKLPMFRSYARARTLTDTLKTDAGGLRDVLRLRAASGAPPLPLEDQIRRVYHDVLDRAPQSWEVGVWVNNINSGTETIVSMRTKFANDPQCETAINNAYQTVLHRNPSPDEFRDARTRLGNGDALAAIKRRLATQGHG